MVPALHNTHKDIHTHKNIPHLCTVNTFPFVIICVDVLIFEHYVQNLFFVFKSNHLTGVLPISLLAEHRFVFAFALSDIAMLAYCLSGTDKCSLSLSHAVHVFTADLKFNSYASCHFTEPF